MGESANDVRKYDRYRGRTRASGRCRTARRPALGFPAHPVREAAATSRAARGDWRSGSALRSHRRGHWFEPSIAHRIGSERRLGRWPPSVSTVGYAESCRPATLRSEARLPAGTTTRRPGSHPATGHWSTSTRSSTSNRPAASVLGELVRSDRRRGGSDSAAESRVAAYGLTGGGPRDLVRRCVIPRRSTHRRQSTLQEPVSEINVVLVHAAAREDRTVTTGTKAWELFTETPDVIAARVGGALRDLAHELVDGDEVEPVAIDSPDGRDILRHSTAHVLAQAVQDLFPDAKLGIGPPIENGFYYDFDVETPFVPEDLEKIETRMRKIIKENQRFQRRPVSDDDARDELAEEPYKLELIGLKGSARRRSRGRERRGRRRRADDLRQPEPQGRGGLEGPVPRPAPAHDQAHPGVQADAVRRGVLAGQREEQAAAAHLRHRLGDQGGARGVPAPHRGGRAARPPQAGSRARPVQLPRRDRLRPGGLPPQGRGDQAGDGGLRPPAPHRGGLRVRRHPAHRQAGALRDLRPPAVLRRRDVPADGDGGQRTTTSRR